MATNGNLKELLRHARMAEALAEDAESSAREAVRVATDAWLEAGRAKREAFLVTSWLERIVGEPTPNPQPRMKRPRPDEGFGVESEATGRRIG